MRLRTLMPSASSAARLIRPVFKSRQRAAIVPIYLELILSAILMRDVTTALVSSPNSLLPPSFLRLLIIFL
jgi:hypothetical protein